MKVATSKALQVMFQILLKSFKQLFLNCHFKMTDHLPIVVILGATGTGKSKLAIEIAEKFGGEVISADSMQVYKGLDIITNKVTTEECGNVVHHLLNEVDALNAYTVVDFRNSALPIIYRLLEERKLPVIVGGTNYYIESLLWKVLVDRAVECGSLLVHERDSEELRNGPVIEEEIDDEILFERLQQIDPQMAKQIHPNDKRKIKRSLQVYEQHGRTHSEILSEQKRVAGGNVYGGPLRFSKSCMLWLQCEPSVLNERLERRVDDMIQRGLLQELEEFHKRYNEQRLIDGSEADYTRGIFQSIGFKEFHSYLTSQDKTSEEAEKMLKEGVDRLKLVTCRYARLQLKWITKRFLKCQDRPVPPVFALDATDPQSWNENVTKPATNIVSTLLRDAVPSIKPLEIAKETEQHSNETVSCKICSITVKGEKQWEEHLKARKHKLLVSKYKKQQQIEELTNTGVVVLEKESICNTEALK